MKRLIKLLFCYILILSGLNFLNFISTTEIETEVKGKLWKCVPDDIEVTKVSTNSKNDAGENVNIKDDNFSNKWQDFVEFTIVADAYKNDTITLLRIEFKYNDGAWCFKEIINSSHQDSGLYNRVEYKVKIRNAWVNVKAYAEFSNGGTADSYYHLVKTDDTKPTVDTSTLLIEEANNGIHIKASIRDEPSGIKSNTALVRIVNSNGSVVEEYRPAGEGNNVNIDWTTTKVTLDQAYTIKFGAEDEAGNRLDITNDGENYHQIFTPKILQTTSPSNNTTTNKVPISTTTTTTTRNNGAALKSSLPVIGGNSIFTCNQEISEFIDYMWKIVLIVGPILMIVMCTIEFVKAMSTSDTDAIKKATSNTVKRTIALVCLMLVKVIVETVLNLFGISICW